MIIKLLLKFLIVMVEGRMLEAKKWNARHIDIGGCGMYENIKREAMKRMIQGLTLPMAEHQRENIELSAIHFEPINLYTFCHPLTISPLLRNEMYCRMQNGSILRYVSEPKQQLKHKISK